jgi:hypothetical protein
MGITSARCHDLHHQLEAVRRNLIKPPLPFLGRLGCRA